MRRGLGISLSIVCILSLLTGCSQGKPKENQEQKESLVQTSSQSEVPFKIGVLQYVQHESLDAVLEGFKEGLQEAGLKEGVDYTLDEKNASGDQSNCPTIASKFVSDKVDLIFAIGTPAAQSAAQATSKIPILVSAVTDPESSGLVKSNKAPGGNVTGTSDLTPIKEQLELLKSLVPEAKKLGVLYSSNEDNSKLQVEMVQEEGEKLGYEIKEATASSSNEIQQVVQSLVGKVDALYIPTDNMMADNMPTIGQVTTPNKIPVICGAPPMVTKGGLATKGISYLFLGKQTAIQAVKIMKGESVPADMPIEYATEMETSYNEEVFKELGIALPADKK